MERPQGSPFVIGCFNALLLEALVVAIVWWLW